MERHALAVDSGDFTCLVFRWPLYSSRFGVEIFQILNNRVVVPHQRVVLAHEPALFVQRVECFPPIVVEWVPPQDVVSSVTLPWEA